MLISDLKMNQRLPQIRQLDDATINRIAAGEVVERPASAVKELVENALDAGARRIEIDYADGGKTLIRVIDDGHGILGSDLPLALARHATSKIDGADLLNVHSFGFRGEALPSLGAVGRLRIRSHARGVDEAAEIAVEGGVMRPARPAALARGTVVELRDLFFATPARLKFLHSDRAEARAIGDVVRRLATTAPFAGFILRDVSGGGAGRDVLRLAPEQGELFEGLGDRLRALIDVDFIENALPIDASRAGYHLTGFAALPTYSRRSAVAQYLSVNGRPVRDRLLIGALRAAYMDVLGRDRHPAAVLNIACDPALVDVNVHPAKSEVRFRDPGMPRGLIISALRHALASAGHRASSTVATAALGAMRPEPAAGGHAYQMARSASQPATEFAEAPVMPWPVSAHIEDAAQDPDEAPATQYPFGTARAQVHENYIIAQTADGIVIVDQHAAHERLVYEKLKTQMQNAGVPAQSLLVPEIVTLSDSDAAILLDQVEHFSRLGLTIEPFGKGAVAVRETPAVLGMVDAEALLRDILDELIDQGDSTTLHARIDGVLSRIACHGSIRSGRRMRSEEMNALLREMEATPLSGQCNHGRPTYVELKLCDIERLFERT